MQRGYWFVAALILTLVAGCGEPQVDLTYSTDGNDLIVQADSTGGLVPEAFRQSHIPLFRLYGDGRVIWTQWAGSRTEVWEGTLSQAEIAALLKWIADEGFFGLEAHYTVKNPPTDMPNDCVRVNLVDTQKTVCEYYDGAPKAFEMIYGRLTSGGGVTSVHPYEPASGWVMAEAITWDPAPDGIPWPESLAPSPSGMGEGTWVEDRTLAYLWQERLERGPWMVYQDGEGYYGLVLQVPGLMPEAPQEP